MTKFFSELASGVAQLLYPALCIGCHKPLMAGEEILCVGCCLELPETNYHEDPENDTVLRFAGRIPFAHATSYAYFSADGLLQHLVHGLKYKGRRDVGRYLGARLGTQLAETSWAADIDLVAPVPLHRAREAKRGFNQTMEIATGIAEKLGVKADGRVLERVRKTESQTKKTREERLKNMASAFRVPDPERIKGKHVLLCDDVLTTGATLEACALALMACHHVKFSIVTIGIALS